MAIFSDIKAGAFLRKQREKTKSAEPKPNRRPVHPDAATSITVVFLADAAEDRKTVDQWRDARQKSGRKIKVVGYFEQEVGAANFDFSVVSVKDLKWSGVPAGPAVDTLQADHTELLLRVGPADHPVLDFLCATTAADLKVGPFSDSPHNPYHLQYDARQATQLKDQFAAIAHIFSFTNADKSTSKI